MATIRVGDHVKFKASSWERDSMGDIRGIVLRKSRWNTTIRIFKREDGSRIDIVREVDSSSLKLAKPLGIPTRVTWRKASSKKVIL